MPKISWSYNDYLAAVSPIFRTWSVLTAHWVDIYVGSFDHLFSTAIGFSTVPLVKGQLFSDNAPSTIVVIAVADAKAAKYGLVEDVWAVFELVDISNALKFKLAVKRTKCDPRT